MSVENLRIVHRDLLDTAWALTEEHPDVCAGSVLRCFARATHQARAGGCPPEQVAAVAAAVTRRLLARRQHPTGVPGGLAAAV